MRLTMEHSDVIKALALYVQTKGFTVEVKPENFVFANESQEPGQFDLVVLVKNADMGAPAPPPPSVGAPQRPAAGRPAPRSAAVAPPPRPAPPARPASKNDMFRPVAPPRAAPPPPKHRILDKQALSSPALALAGQHPHMPAAQAVVHAYEGAETASNYVDDEGAPDLSAGNYRSPMDTGLLVDPADMSPEDRAVFEEILERSAANAETGPVYADDSANDPILPGGYLDDA